MVGYLPKAQIQKARICAYCMLPTISANMIYCVRSRDCVGSHDYNYEVEYSARCSYIITIQYYPPFNAPRFNAVPPFNAVFPLYLGTANIFGFLYAFHYVKTLTNTSFVN